MEGQAHPTYYDVGLDHSILSMALYEPHYPHITAFREELSTWRFYYFEPRTLMREDVPVAEVEAIGPRGENLAAFLNLIQANDGGQIKAFNLALKYLLPQDSLYNSFHRVLHQQEANLFAPHCPLLMNRSL